MATEVFERERRLEAKKMNWVTDGGSPVTEQCVCEGVRMKWLCYFTGM